jgi:hypothetical protein
MPRRTKLLTGAEARPNPTGKQHTSPCSDCPWARAALPGWLGSMSAEEWLQLAHGEGGADCHAIQDAQCAGLAVYRANNCKSLRDPEAFRLPPNRTTVFSNPNEFRNHHATLPRKKS